MPLKLDSNKLLDRMKKRMIDDQVDNISLRILLEDQGRENQNLKDQVAQLNKQIQELSKQDQEYPQGSVEVEIGTQQPKEVETRTAREIAIEQQQQ